MSKSKENLKIQDLLKHGLLIQQCPACGLRYPRWPSDEPRAYCANISCYYFDVPFEESDDVFVLID